MTDVKEAKKLVKDLDSDKPDVIVKAAEVVLEEVEFRKDEPKVKKKPVDKTIYVNLSSVRPEVTFTGNGWCAVDIKMCYAAIVRKFKENLRELYRKEYKKNERRS